MEAFLKTLEGAGAYLAVFMLGAAVVTWLLRDRTRILAALDKSNERLLDEREKRAQEAQETTKLISDASVKFAEHTKTLEKVLDRWTTSSPA